MKGLRIIAASLVLGAAGAAGIANAQENTGGDDTNITRSDFYVVQIPIERVFAHNKGYMVEYRKTPLVNKTVFLPMEWFVPSKENTGPLKGEVVLMGTGKNWPYMSVYYKDGKMDHVRLHVRRDDRHFTWGYIGPNADIDKRFENLSDLQLEYK